ncbi:MAG: FKBP-type peptidyl-prolyl cis-trans isomerase [Saprospiraceae bacterium]|nr:FKBP-type peptidyl-prolyl cis-trans isomerase [Saprospiraceae bacterium]
MRNLNLMQYLFVLSVLIIGCKGETGDFTTGNGYKYTVHKKGSGKTAAINDYIFYAATVTADGDTLQSNNDPENYPYMQLPKDWKDIKPPSPFYEVLSKVMVGDSITIYVPGDSIPPGNPSLVGKKELRFVLSIKDIMDSTAYAAFTAKKRSEMEAVMAKSKERLPGVEKTITETLALYKAKNLKVETTPSGLQYVIHEKGTGPVAAKGQKISVDYHGVLKDGTKFDSSFERGMRIEFPVGVGNVIPGWDEALTLLPEGTKATLFIPSNLAYGDQQSGPIPPNSDLVFYIEFQKIK